MNHRLFFVIIILSLLTLVGCSLLYPSNISVNQPHLNLNHAKVGLIVRNNTAISVPDLEKLLAEGFVQAIRWYTLYDISVAGRPSDYPYLLTISVEDLKAARGGLGQIKLRTVITDTKSHTTLYDATFEERINSKTNFYANIVKDFPNYPKPGLPPGQTFQWLDPSEATPSAADYPDAAALYLVDEADWNLHIKRSYLWTPLTKYGSLYTTENRHVAIKILNERGYKYAEVLVPFDEHTHLEKLTARTITKDGRIVEVSEDQIHTVDLFPQFVFFSDAKAKKFTFPALEPGSIIEYMYTSVTESVALWGSFSFQKPEPVLRSSFSLDVPVGMEFKTAFHCPDYLDDSFKEKAKSLPSWASLGAYRENSSPKSVRKTTQYQLYNLPAVPLEEQMPFWDEVSARLTFCSATFGGEGMLCSFPELGDWYAKMVSDAFISSAPVLKKADEMTKDCDTVEEKIRAIYHYIQEHYRYLAVEFGIGRIVPPSPDEVFDLQYGDCKGLSTLMVSMLRSLGIKAYPALLRTRDEGELDGTYIALSQFNHMIVYVEDKGKELWFDPTADNCAFLSLPWQDQGVKALVVKPNNSCLITTPTATARDNSIKTEWDVKLSADGKLIFQVQNTVTGQEQFLFRSALEQLSDKEQKDFLSQYVTHKFPRAQLTSYQGGNLNEKDAPLALSYQFETPVPEVGELLLFELPLQTEAVSFTQKERTHPIIFDYPYSQIDEMKIHLPAGYTVEALPEAVDVNTEFGTLKISLTESQDTIIYCQEISWDAKSISASEYENLCRFQQKIISTERQNIALKKSDIEPQ